MMKLSLREVTIKAVDAYASTPRCDWVLSWPGQVVLAASTVHWTAEVTQVCQTLSQVKYPSKSHVNFRWFMFYSPSGPPCVDSRAS